MKIAAEMDENVHLISFIKFNYYYMKILGLYPFKLTPDHKMVLIKNLKHSNLFVTLCLIVLFSIISSRFKNQMKPAMESDLFLISHLFLILSNITMAIWTAIMNQTHQKASLRLWNNLIQLDRDLHAVKIYPKYKILYKIYLPVMAIEIVVVIFYTVVMSGIRASQLDLGGLLAFFFWLFFCFTNLISYSTTCCFTSIFSIIKTMFRALEVECVNNLDCQTITVESIQNVAKIHKKLCANIKLGNSILSFQLLLIVLFYFITFTLNAFYVVSTAFEGKFHSYSALSSAWIIFCQINFFNLVIIAELCQNAVSN